MAAVSEFDHETPAMETIAQVLEFIGQRAQAVPAGHWIVVEQVFITRLREQRFPTRVELEAAAPGHPVCFSTGSDIMLNTLALRESGIDRGFVVAGAGVVERDANWEPTGLLRGLGRYVHIPPAARIPDDYSCLKPPLRSNSSVRSCTSDQSATRPLFSLRDLATVATETTPSCSPQELRT
jgi:predicted amidohydrolase YtcJ